MDNINQFLSPVIIFSGQSISTSSLLMITIDSMDFELNIWILLNCFYNNL